MDSSTPTAPNASSSFNPTLFNSSASSGEENGSKSLSYFTFSVEAMKRQSLESCARDFVNNLKKSAMARSSIEVDAEKPVEPTAPASKWDAFVGNPVAEGVNLFILLL